ncbi:cyclase family protein [Rhizobium sp. SSA_523]|uniref:cyclase family protein n=1 Tax=Rhizobium sp. SSA_523 TaxID=2952477 RepID=UPI0020918829|nr:cyclase family protein [Rhizobium sp. SSA_523]MCO5731642.1 cyclase family protein [Rhizobium sp. SSA_523]WKC21852.1 cyclase family protein [Rhizobium sp. SSA_523]
MQRWKNRPEGSNWGEFGEDDQVGRMNLLTADRRLRGAQEIREGHSFCLSLPLDYPGGNVLFPYRKPPVFHHEKRGEGHNFNYRLSGVCDCYSDVICDDAVTLYTQYSTQWDALSHVGQMFDADGDGIAKKVYYNGFRGGHDIVGPDERADPDGARALGIEKLAVAGVQGRGVLVDLERIYGHSRVAVGYDEMMAAIEAQKIDVLTGDFLCVYTGFADVLLSMNRSPDGEVLARSCAALDGRDSKLLNWITDSGIVAICADNFAVEIYPARMIEGDSFPGLPLHNHCLFKLGIHLGELWYFSELAAWLRKTQRSAFFLTAPPLRLPGSVGSPLTPVATV